MTKEITDLDIYENASEEEWRNVINSLKEKDKIKIGEQPGVYAGLENRYSDYELDFFPAMIYVEGNEMKKRYMLNQIMYVDETVLSDDLNFKKYHELLGNANEN